MSKTLKALAVVGSAIVLPAAVAAQEAGAPTAKADDPGVWRASVGANYSEGDYGEKRQTRVVSAPVALKGSVANSDTVSKIGLMYCQGQLR